MNLRSLFIVAILLTITCWLSEISAQKTIIGIVTDSTTNEPLPFIAISVKGSRIGAMTDNSGKFLLRVPESTEIIRAASVGYKEKFTSVGNENVNHIKIKLSHKTHNLSVVTIKPSKNRYKKKGNAAVDFVKKVIASKNQFSPLNKEYYQYEHYEKVSLAINNFRPEKNTDLLNRYKIIANYIDTSKISGRPILPVSSKEMLENYYYQKSPHSEKRVVKAKKSAGIDEMLSEDGVSQFLGEVFKDVDIYQNDITLFLKPFVSPLSVGGPDFYKYYLLDTVKIDEKKYVDLGFVPFLSESTGFTGHLLISLDSTYFLKKVVLNIPRDINLNFVQNLSIDQEFNRAPDGTRLLMKDHIIVEFALLSRADGFYAERSNINTQHSFERPSEAVFKQQENTIVADNASHQTEDYWKENSPDSVADRKKTVDKMLANLRKDPVFYYSEKVFSALVTGYLPTSDKNNKFSFGPIYSTFSSNTVEGLRLRTGGFTTANFDRHWFGSGYLAYGTIDQKLKYDAGIEYSFNKKKEKSNEFPIHSIRAAYNYDLNRLGQYYKYASADNILLSLKRQPDDKVTYVRNIELNYNRDFYSQLSMGIDLKYRTEYATPFIPFTDYSTGNQINAYSEGIVKLRLRYAPGEKFYQTFRVRRSFSRDAPVFTLFHSMAKKGVLGSDYDYSFTELGFQKRFWFSAFGNVNVIINAGKIWTKTPFTLLSIPNANLSYTTQYESYTMMNAMEFINDQFVSWDLNYNMNGLILNRIPFLKKLKLREIVSFRGLYGNLSPQNDPAQNGGIFTFPTGVSKMGKDPYMEVGIGVINILKIFRVDYIWRLSYLDKPNIDRSGFRFNMDFYF